MVGITPNGAVSHVSSAYGGSASDCQIIERSSLLNEGKFDAGDRIMADRGIFKIYLLIKMCLLTPLNCSREKVSLNLKILFEIEQLPLNVFMLRG